MTHPFHPLSGQRLRVLFERRLPGGPAVSCAGGPLGSVMLPLAWTGRGPAAAEGPLTAQRRRCGKEGCRCAQGELHGPYAYLPVAGRVVYVPAALAEAVQGRLEESARMRRSLEEISAINLELLARRDLD